MRRLALIVVLLVVAWPAAADASGGRWGLTDTGDPLLSVPVAVPDSDLGEWFACPRGEPCRRIAERVRRFEPGPTPLLTVFESETLNFSTGPIDEHSPYWQGRVAATAAPAMDGVAAVGSTVTPVGARWTGGWGNETSSLSLIECPRRESRTDCRYVHGPLARGGWYLYAIDRRAAADHDPNGPVALPPPPDAPTIVPAASALVAVSAPIGPVAASKTAPDPNAKYKVTLRSRALVDRRDITVGRISCPVRCAVELTVSGVRRKFNALGTVPVALLDAPRLRAGALQVKVMVDGRRAASGTVKR